jgi:FkbM family methyltransferase
MNLLEPLGVIDASFLQEIANFRRMKATTAPDVYDAEFFRVRCDRPHHGFVEVQNDDVRPFFMLTNDDDVIAEFFLWYGRGSYERTTIREWVRRLKSADVVFDVGANTGIYSLLSCFADDRHRKIVAFEPTLRACSRIYDNLIANRVLDRVKVEKTALSNESGTVTFMHFENVARISSGASYVEGLSPYDVQSKEECQRTTLDAYIAEGGLVPDLIKIDVEGAEVDVMKGAKDLIAKRATCFIIEVVKETAEQVIEHFDGYTIMLLDDHLNRIVPWSGDITRHLHVSSPHTNLLIEP